MKRLLRNFVIAPLGVGTVSLAYFLRYPRPRSWEQPEADNAMFSRSRDGYLPRLPMGTLLRGLFVHSFCAHQRLVDLGILMMKAHQKRHVPVLDTFLRHTFFAQFCGLVPHEILS